jgi:hypothetical protein
MENLRPPTANCSLLRTLLGWQTGANFLKRVIAIFNYSAQEIISIDGNGLKQD